MKFLAALVIAVGLLGWPSGSHAAVLVTTDVEHQAVIVRIVALEQQVPAMAAKIAALEQQVATLQAQVAQAQADGAAFDVDLVAFAAALRALSVQTDALIALAPPIPAPTTTP